MLAEWCKVKHVFLSGRMRSRRQRSAINTVAQVVSRMQEAWAQGKKASMLLVDIKGAFNHVS